VDAGLQARYDSQYTDTALRAWRQAGALDKAARLLALIDRAGLRPASVLEVGAGEGSVLHALGLGLQQRGLRPELHALEISASGVAAIGARGIAGLAAVQRFDGYRLPYPDGAVDLVVLCHVLEHVEYERTLLRELHRVARWVLIEVPRELQPGAHRRWRHYLSYGHINLYSPSGLRFLLATEGLAVQHELLGVTGAGVLRANYSVPYSWRVRLEYALRRALVALPVASLRERYCNTITVLAQPVARPALFGG
jgi:hypothetical protein